MKNTRVIQNFTGRQALLALGQSRSRDTLVATLARLGIEAVDIAIEEWIGGEIGIPVTPEGHLAFIDLDLAFPSPQSDGAAVGLCPTIALIGSEVPSRLRLMVELGATASLTKPVYGGSVYSALFLAVNEFNLRAGLHQRLRDYEERRRKRPALISAIIRLMAEGQCDEAAAFLQLRRDSMRHRMSIEDYAESFLDRPRPDQTLPVAPGLKAARG
ncbi:ANTAR domain-containing response regulator [Paracoccus aminophilus]|uniref:Response regulator receiver n=1 Tax=Paracoccus aminophilus JCM 7686 TaxID=1367847 RepID=S5YZT3_PARAH|nr:ANTAR domain-containing protein [Paracoccus aminophilus]AGT10721.1 response regulator receiver [Paracoccus aminophilus JCM 7686]